jgi:hypothetical protein
MLRRASILAVLAVLSLGAVPVLAAPPSNDDIANSTAVTLGFSETIDTTEATSDPNDPSCFSGSGAGDQATVWYSYAAAVSSSVGARTTGSDYDTTIYVGTSNGSGGIDVIDCVDDTPFGLQAAVRWDAQSGTTYLIAVGTCCGGDGAAGGGGSLTFSIQEAAPAPTIDLTVSGRGSAGKDGSATVGGTVTCSAETPVVVEAFVSQRVGRRVFQAGGSSDEITCSTDPSSWEVTVISGDGLFAGGHATVDAFTSACNEFDCNVASVQATVSLRRK